MDPQSIGASDETAGRRDALSSLAATAFKGREERGCFLSFAKAQLEACRL
jgi:hypothetical protein